ncbi:hypothetical protein ACT048_23535 [Ectopseudomonas khazarica]|uniref:hypothetical protein n=1 Tax=Ectopseudomonas khazarica TaxID=2502979 RepID=UPI004034159C
MSLQRRRPSRAVAGWQHGTNTAVLMAGAAYGAVMAAGVIARSERCLHSRRDFVAASVGYMATVCHAGRRIR